jgi:hypothetical protein
MARKLKLFILAHLTMLAVNVRWPVNKGIARNATGSCLYIILIISPAFVRSVGGKQRTIAIQSDFPADVSYLRVYPD